MAIDMGNTKVVLVCAQEGFEEDELFVPENVFSDAGAFVKIASNDVAPAHGAHEGEANPDIAIWRIGDDSLEGNYDALVIAGGPGAPRFLWANPELLGKIREANAKGKVIGAIGLATVALAQAGIMRGRRCAAVRGDLAMAELRRHEVILEDVDAATDGNVITARGTADAKLLAELVLGLLKERLAAPSR